MVAALNIVASLVLLVIEKSPDIAILKTMGASSRSIMAVFMLQGLVIGAVGTFIGASMGYAVATVLDRYRLVPRPDGRLPDCVRAVCHRRTRPGGGRRNGPRHLLRGDNLPVATRRPASNRWTRCGSAGRHGAARRLDLHKSYTVAALRLPCCAGSRSPSRRARWWPSSERPGWARARCCTCSAASTTPTPAQSGSGRRRCTTCATAKWWRSGTTTSVSSCHHLLPEFNAVENAEMPLRIARLPLPEARRRATELLERVGLGGRLAHRPAMMSGGEQQHRGHRPRAGRADHAAPGRRADRQYR